MKWIDTTSIKQWADRRDCQESLPLVIRKLIRATVESVNNIKFPSGDSVLIGGWDGILNVNNGTEYIPEGISLWEFGSNRDCKGKADSDYEKRTKDPLGFNHKESTFVFVTPRLWTKGEKWATKKKKEGNWKDVVVINAEILEEWIEMAPTVGSWLSKHIGIYPEGGIQPTDDFWEEWSSGKQLCIKPELLLGGRIAEKDKLIKLAVTPSIIPVQATSKEESIAFIISCYKDNKAFEEDFFSRSIIVDTVETFRKLAVHTTPLILIPRFEDDGVINRAMKNGHTIIIPLGIDAAANWENIIILPPISRDEFVSALINMGIARERAEKYSRDTVRNITILRRQLEFNRNQPAWSSPENITDIIPALIIGRWDESFERDREVIAKISGHSYNDYIKILSKWLIVQDAPILKIGDQWRLTSPLDAWSYASLNIMDSDFKNLRETVLTILREKNPALELPSENRMMAPLYGKSREFSHWIREGVLQSLILTSIFGDRLNLNLCKKSNLFVDGIIQEVLDTSDSIDWKSFENMLPLIAEASPRSFLDAVEKQIVVDDSPIIFLFDEEPDLISSKSYHCGLLWALESLAWFPEYLARVTLLLANLTEIDPGGKLSNRPINSLINIYKPWCCQTLAPFKDRIQVLELLSHKNPNIAWILLINLLPGTLSNIANFTSKTRWRMLDLETKPKMSYLEEYETYSAIIDLLKKIFDFSEIKYVQLIEQSYDQCCFQGLFPFIKECAPKVAHKKNLAWAKIRELLSHHRSCSTADWTLSECQLKEYDKLYSFLEPTNEIDKDIWVFNTDYIPFIDGHDLDKMPRDERYEIIHKKREGCVKRIYSLGGIKEVLRYAGKVTEKFRLGVALAGIINLDEEVIQLCHLLKDIDSDYQFINAFILTKVRCNGIEWGLKVFGKLEHLGFDNDVLVNFLIPLPQSMILWNFIDSKNNDITNWYWQKLDPCIHLMSVEVKVFALNKLISHKRYITAVKLSYQFSNELPTEILLSVLDNAGTNESDENAMFRKHEIEKLFKILYDRDGIRDDVYIKLEWLYIPILASYGSSLKPKILHNELAQNPELFIDILKYAYLPKDKELLKQENKNISDILVKNRKINASKLLMSWKVIPGVSPNGDVDKDKLYSWVNKVRELAINVDRKDVADYNIGRILAQYPESTTVWPPDEICKLIEYLQSEVVNRNYSVALSNKRSFTSRGTSDGGNIERENATSFRSLASYHRNRFPSVSVIFEKLAIKYDHMAEREDEDAEKENLEY